MGLMSTSLDPCPRWFVGSLIFVSLLMAPFSGLVQSSLVCLVQSAVVSTLMSLQTIRNGVRVRTRRLSSEGCLIVAS